MGIPNTDPPALWPDGALERLGDDQCGYRRLLLANDRKRAGSSPRPHHPPGIQSGAPAVSLLGGPFHRPRNRHRQCGPIGRTQDAAVGLETAPLSGQGELAIEHSADPRNADGARGVAGPTATARHRQHGPIDKTSTQLGDAHLLRPIAHLLGRSQRRAIVTRRCRGKIRRQWPVLRGSE